MQSLDDQVRCLLDGHPVTETYVDIIGKDKDNAFKPLTKLTVCYIVTGIAFNDKGEVLMMQEAKSVCRGSWYLPAGRLEPGESLVDGVKREVTEETGLQYEPTALIACDNNGGKWFRFSFIGNIIGGKLKRTSDADIESLQAEWCSLEKVKNGTQDFYLRAPDILPLIDIGLRFHKMDVNVRHPSHLPISKPQKQMILRALIIHQKEDNCEVVSNTTSPHLPSCLISPTDHSLTVSIFRILKGVFTTYLPSRPDVGVLSVEFCGKPQDENDGVCLTLLLCADNNYALREQYEWTSVKNDKLIKQLKDRSKTGRTIPLLFH